MTELDCTHLPGCITCGDLALPLTVTKVGRDHIAICTDDQGATEEVDVSLLEQIEEGDTVLVHARVALTRLSDRTVNRQPSTVHRSNTA